MSDLAPAAGSGAQAVTVPIPIRKPVLETQAPVLLVGGFLTDAAVAPDAAAIAAYRVASAAPRGAKPKEPVLSAVPIPKPRPNPPVEPVEVAFAAVANPLVLAPVVRTPVGRVVAQAAARDRGRRVAKRYRRPVSSEMGG